MRCAACGDTAAFIIANVVNDEVAAQILKPSRAGDHVVASQVVAHHFDAEVAAGLHNAADRFLVGPGHHHDMRGASLGHQLGFQVAAVHGFQVGHDGRLRKPLSQGANAVHAFGDNQRRTGLQPVDASAQCHLGSGNGFLNRDNIQRDLNDRMHMMKPIVRLRC